jgi:hypothetical protein
MPALPSIWSLMLSTVVFFVAVWYVRRYLDEQGIPKGMTRGMLVLTLASLVSWGAGKAVDWAWEKMAGHPPRTQTSADVPQLLESQDSQSAGRPQP